MVFDLLIQHYLAKQLLEIAHSSKLRALLQFAELQKKDTFSQFLRTEVIDSVDLSPAALAAITHLPQAAVAEYWLLHPVHLALSRDTFVLTDKLHLSPEVAHDLTVLFCQFFAPDQMNFTWLPAAQVWLLQKPDVWGYAQTAPLSQVLGKNIAPFEVTSADGGKLRALQNQLQMLLHEHPINQAREQAGELAVNSLWFEAGGVLPNYFKINPSVLVGEHDLLNNLSHFSHQTPIERHLQARTFSENSQAHVLALLSAEHQLDWLDLVAQQFSQRKISHLRLTILPESGDAPTQALHLRQADLWKKWRLLCTHPLNKMINNQ